MKFNKSSIRTNFIKDLNDNAGPNDRILEIGPLINPLVEKKDNVYYADIKDTESIKLRYKDYSNVDIDKVVSVDFVIADSYEESLKNVEKFDYVVNCHVLEHIPNPIHFFNDISKCLCEEGKLIMMVPDKRYCFDHYRENSSFSLMYAVYKNYIDNKVQVIDSVYNGTYFTKASIYWDIELSNEYKKADYFDVNLNAIDGKFANSFDGHFWTFTDVSFLKIILDITRSKLFPFEILQFQPSLINTNEFGVILKKNEKLLFDEGEMVKQFDKIIDLMNETLKFHAKYHEMKYNSEKDGIIDKQVKIISEKDSVINKQENLIKNLLNSNSWRLTKPLRRLARLFK